MPLQRNLDWLLRRYVSRKLCSYDSDWEEFSRQCNTSVLSQGLPEYKLARFVSRRYMASHHEYEQEVASAAR